MAVLEVPAQPGAGWDEAQCTTALAHLEQLQAQLDDLRLAIPRVIDPFHRPPNSSTFRLYAQGALSSQDAIKNLHREWKSPETQSTFEHVRESLGANDDLAASASVPSHGWVERERRARDSKRKGDQNENAEELGATLTNEDVSNILVEFQKTNPKITLEIQDDNCIILTRFVSGSTMLRFRVTIEREANDRHKLNAECLGTTEPFLAITRCLGTRTRANDLKYVLDMIAAYKNVKATSCAKCGQLLDDSMMIPTARRSKQVAGLNNTTETKWEAFHEGCLE